MSFESQVKSNELVIGDDNYRSHIWINSPNRGTGLLPREIPYGELGFAARFEDSEIPLIPEDEWKERIEDKERNKTRLSDMIERNEIPFKDQGSLPYCWIYAPVHAVEVLRMIQNEPYVALSATACGAKIKDFEKVGGWGSDGLKFLAEHGCPSELLWPNLDMSRTLDNQQTWEEAKRHKVVEAWFDMPAKSVPHLISCLLANIPVPVGYNWWRHEVLATDAVWHRGGPAIRIRNQWADWGSNGFGILHGRKMEPDDQVAPRAATPGGAL